MAYTIISQNNSTTTLSDGVNTITVPSRVNLTSGNFTIVEVNNNMATLEDGDGNVYRDIPCVATLAGEGGGGSSLPDQTGHSGEFLTTDGTDASWAAVDALPDQTGNSGKFLTTDGTSPSWSDKPLVNTADSTGSLGILGSTSTGNTTATAVGYNASCSGSDTTALGNGATASVRDSTAIGKGAVTSARAAIQIGEGTNSTAGTVCFGFEGTNYTILDANKEIPTDRLTNAINKYSSMPTAGADYLGQIAQFTGTTDANYTHGYIYECVSDGGNPATYSWTEVQLGGGGSSYTAGTGIDITSGVISVTAPTLQNTATGTYALTIGGTATNGWGSVNIGDSSSITGEGNVAIGKNATIEGSTAGGCISIGYRSKVKGYKNSFYTSGIAIGQYAQALIPTTTQMTTDKSGAIAIGDSSEATEHGGIAIGHYSRVTAAHAIQIWAGSGMSGMSYTNADANTLKVGNENGNFEMMSADGTIPTARLTKVNSTITLTAAGWSSNTQTVNVTGMTATGIVFPSPDPTDQSAYTSAGILCTAQAAGTLTFTCTSVPSADIDVNVVML